MKIEIYKGGFIFKSWKWRLVDEDGDNIGYGSGFNKKQGAEKSVDAIQRIVRDDSAIYEIYVSGKIRWNWKWRIKSSNGRILAADKGFLNEEECVESLSNFKNYFKKQQIET